jgi:hypothetical protein
MPEKKQLVAPDIRLSKRQKAYADNLLVTQDSTQSAIKAGYKGTQIRCQASKLKHNPQIRAYLELRAKELVTTHEPQLVAMANALKDKDQTLIYALKQMQECKAGSPTGFKYFELLAKLNQHLNENKSQNLFLNTDGKDITIDEVIADANEARLILRQIRMESQASPTEYEVIQDEGEQGESQT